jgi:cation-transporting ATPase E
VVHFAFPAGIVTFLFGLFLYVFTFNSIVNQGRKIDVLESDVASFQKYAGIDYAIYTQDQFVYEVAVLFSQTVLTTFSILSGLGLVLFVEPPYRWLVGGDKYSGDKRPLLLCLLMLALFVWVMAVPRFRQFWELLELEAVDYALIIGTTVVWAFVLRYVWRVVWAAVFFDGYGNPHPPPAPSPSDGEGKISGDYSYMPIMVRRRKARSSRARPAPTAVTTMGSSAR